MTYEEARNAIQSYLDGNWVSTPPSTIAYDNLAFTPPNGAPWIRLAIQNNIGFQAGLGGSVRRFRRQGIALILVFVPEGSGPTQATQLAEEAVLLFEGVLLPGGLRFDLVNLREVGVEAGWFQINVSAGFSFDDIR